MIEKKTIKLRSMTANNRLILLTGERGDIHRSIDALKACGWFVTKEIKETFKVALMHSLDYMEYELRADNVMTGCSLVKEKNFVCRACRFKVN